MHPSPELRELLLRYYEASGRGDADFLEQLIAREPGALVIGTADEEWWQGGDEIARTWAGAWRTRGGLRVTGGNPEAYELGDLGWAADHAIFRLPNGSERPFRLSAVFKRVEGAWQLVHAHFSFGVPN